MSKSKVIIIMFSIIVIMGFILLYKSKNIFINNTTNPPTEQPKIDSYGVTYNGWLTTNGSILENEKGETIQLRGVSSHGIEWFSDVITYENLEYLKKEWNINVFRIAMYTDSNGSGYIFSPEQTKEKVFNIIDMAIELDMYVIVDWHILNDSNPQMYKEEAKTFFDEISKRYKSKPNVIYEICNEPNGKDVTWEKDIKPYAEELIPIIRNNAQKSLIIVGTPDWCTNLKKAADNPINIENIVYSCHFYSGTHGEGLRKKVDYCIEKNIPIFVSECGLTNEKGDGDVYFDKFKEWIKYLDSNRISWIYWSFSNKNESSAILSKDYTETIENHLTEAGKFVKNIFQNYK